MDKILKAEFEKEVKELNDILFLATESYKIVELMTKKETDEHVAYVKNNNNFLTYTMITNWRITVLELCKLLSGKGSEHYDILRFINKLKPGETYESAGIEPAMIETWRSKLKTERSAIANLVIQRNKLYAHTDKDYKSIKNSVTVSKAKELLALAQSVVREIYYTTFTMGFSFDAFNSPVNNLQTVITSLAQQRRGKMEVLKKNELEHGITYEFK